MGGLIIVLSNADPAVVKEALQVSQTVKTAYMWVN